MGNPGKLHWAAVKRIFRYLKSTTDFGLRYSHGSTLNLEAYCDTDWTGNVNDRNSASGYLFKLANGLISWGGRKQKCVAPWTGEAEYLALGLSIQEGILINGLL